MKSSVTRMRLIGKSGSDWNDDDIEKLNIKVVRIKSFKDFFHEDEPRIILNDNVNEFLKFDLSNISVQTQINLNKSVPQVVRTLIKDIIAVTKTHRTEESAVDDMSRTIFLLFEYDDNNLSIRTRPTLRFKMAKSNVQANPDICIEAMDTSIKLLVQEDKSYDVASDKYLKSQYPEAQLIAEAIAAYQENCTIFKNLGREDEIPERQVIPGIVMLGTCPTFYKIPVSQELSKCIKAGDIPQNITTIEKYIIPNMIINKQDIMLSRDHIGTIANCYTSFRKFLP